VYLCICICGHVSTCIRVYELPCIRIVCLGVYVCVYMHTHVYIYIYVCIYMCLGTYVCLHIHVYIYMYMSTYMYVYSYIICLGANVRATMRQTQSVEMTQWDHSSVRVTLRHTLTHRKEKIRATPAVQGQPNRRTRAWWDQGMSTTSAAQNL